MRPTNILADLPVPGHPISNEADASDAPGLCRLNLASAWALRAVIAFMAIKAHEMQACTQWFSLYDGQVAYQKRFTKW